MSDTQRIQTTTPDVASAVVREAWERFVDGDDDVSGVRPEIAISWQRSRDRYHIDPYLAEAPNAATSEVPYSADQDVVFAELGFSAAAMAHEIANAGAVVTIADAGGRILTAWGDKKSRSVALAGGMAPWYCWSEGTVGTNSMGTALETQRAVMIRQSEHWCRAFHDWSCGGIAVRDVVTREPLAVLNISSWRGALPPAAQKWLEGAAAHTQSTLRMHAQDSATEMLASYASARGRSHDPLVAVDAAGAVVIADETASVILGVPADTPAVDPVSRWIPQLPSLIHAARYATKQAKVDPGWTGSTQIYTSLSDEPSSIAIRPVFQYGNLIGHLISFGASNGEQYAPPVAGAAPSARATRVVALRGENRMVLLAASEVAVAHSDGSDAWLITDEGKLRAATAGLDKLEGDLAESGGFLRVHRQYLVNLNRVREVERRAKGELVLVMDDPDSTQVPVSRRSTSTVRRALNI